MNEKITDKLVDWMSSLENIVGEELPTFVREVAEYGFWSGLGQVFIFILIIFFLALCIKYCIKNSDDDLVKAKCCPKLYVIERLVKK